MEVGKAIPLDSIVFKVRERCGVLVVLGLGVGVGWSVGVLELGGGVLVGVLE